MLQRVKKIGSGCLMALGVLFLFVVLIHMFIPKSNTARSDIGVPIFTSTPALKVVLPTVTPTPRLPTITPTPRPPTATPTVTPDPAEIKAAAIELPAYKELLRHIETYTGQFVHFQGEIAQVLDDGGVAILRVEVEPGYAVYARYSGSERFLKTDIVEVWGTVDGVEDALTVRLVSVKEPRIIIRFIEFLSE